MRCGGSRLTDGLGHTSTVLYDAAGHVQTQIDAGQPDDFQLRRRRQRADRDHGWAVSPRPATTGAQPRLREIAAGRPGHDELRYAVVDVQTQIDPLGRRTTFVYDWPRDRLAAVVDPLASGRRPATTRRATSCRSPMALNHTSTAVYDATDRLPRSTRWGNRTRAWATTRRGTLRRGPIRLTG